MGILQKCNGSYVVKDKKLLNELIDEYEIRKNVTCKLCGINANDAKIELKLFNIDGDTIAMRLCYSCYDKIKNDEDAVRRLYERGNTDRPPAKGSS